MKDLILIAGATGYVGGELLKKLLAGATQYVAWRGVRKLSERRPFPGSRLSKEMFSIPDRYGPRWLASVSPII